MNWATYLQEHQIILLFLIIALGFLLGRIRIWTFSFEASGILFVAMIFGHFGFSLNDDLQSLGLIFFIYAIGLQAGPSIFHISKKEGLQLNGLVFLIIAFGALLTYGATLFWQLDMSMAIGLFAGALTSTPGLAAAQETTQSALTSTGYGIAYPFGVIGVILFIKLLPVFYKVSLKKEERQEEKKIKATHEAVIWKEVEITNRELNGRILKSLHFYHHTGTVISRIFHEGQLIVPDADTAIHIGDIVRIVGNQSEVEAAVPLLGRVSRKKMPEAQQFESRRFVVTNKDIIGKTIAQLNLRTYYDANITRIRRGGLEFSAEPDQKLQWGDRVRVAGDAAQMDQIRRLFGDEMRKVEFGDIFAIIMGILLGIAAGLIPFSIGRALQFNLGVTGGVLLAGLFLSNRGKIGPIVWQVPVPIIAFMRELGLTLFLAVVGVKAGAQVFHIIQTQGIQLILIGILITILPMALVTLVARMRYKMLLIELFGVLSGGMTSSPGLAAATGLTESQRPLILYATVYPFAMILMMVMVKLLALMG